MNFSQKKKSRIYVSIIILVVLILFEMFLRLVNFKPGIFQHYSNFQPVDSLIVYKNFKTDDFGIYSFSEWVSDSIPMHFDFETNKPNDFILEHFSPLDDVFDVFLSYKMLETDKDLVKNPLYFLKKSELIDKNTSFYDFYRKKINEGNAKTELDFLIDEYVKKPYNRHGFRSIPFVNLKNTKRPKILLIGDSFVYGMSSKPYYCSFYDILLSKEYCVYNAGIPGVDPAQYLAIAKKYIPILQPDIVIVNFFPGNDYMYFKRRTVAEEPHEHITNAGFFESSPKGEYLNPLEAYNFYLSLSQIPAVNIFNRSMSTFSITSILWKILFKANLVEHKELSDYENFRNSKYGESLEITKCYLDSINSICKQYNTALINSVIPYRYDQNIKENTFFTVDTTRLNELFAYSNYQYPKNLLDEDFYKDSYHFNKSGAKKYAEFLDSLIVLKTKNQ
jgi:hypothetical protein